MLWAACCLAFFGFLRVSEFTLSHHSTYDREIHLSLTDISLDNRDDPHVITVSIKTVKDRSFFGRE